LLADRVLVFSKGPGQILADIHIDLPRPRSSSLRRSAAFSTYEEQILTALYGQPFVDADEVEQADAEEIEREVGQR